VIYRHRTMAPPLRPSGGQPTEEQPAPDELRNSSGRTWKEEEAHIKEVYADRNQSYVERKLRVRKLIFDREVSPNPIVELRQQLFEDAVRAAPPERRQGVIESLKKTWT
jgi:hypothetical protein